MKFNEYEKIYEAVGQDALQSVLQRTMNPTLVAQVTSVLLGAPHSDLSRFIVNRLTNSPNTTLQKFEIRKVGTLESYKKDSSVYNALLHITENGVGPGEILLSLTDGQLNGGTQSDYDLLIPGLGKVEVKYLGHFAKSTNVPLGSSESKNIDHSDLQKIISGVGQIVRKSPEVLKGCLTGEDLDYFITNTIDQISDETKNLSTNSLRIISRLLRNCEMKKLNVFSSQGITFKKMADAMENALKAAVGPADYIMFLGDKAAPGGDMYNPIYTGGQYYVMPKSDIKYYMVYRMYKHERIKMAPFTTEKDFFDKPIKE